MAHDRGAAAGGPDDDDADDGTDEAAGAEPGAGPAYQALVAAADPAMVVVTAAGDDGPSGCLVGFSTECSMAPHRYLVALSRANHTYAVARSATHLGVHLLGAEQHELAAWFGERSGDDVDKLTAVRWRPGPGGTPVLADAPAWFVGRIVVGPDQLVTDTDHGLFVLAPVEAGSASMNGADAGDDVIHPLRLHDVRDLDPGHPA